MNRSQKTREYVSGLKNASFVGVGYFAVSFGFGALAASKGVSVWGATLISLVNLTSAGQFAGLTVIVALGSLWELILTQLVINSRYMLMSLALTQRLDKSFTAPKRMVMAFFNTDEIFALSMQRQSPLTFPYMLGLGTLPIIGWSAGTLCGALAGTLLPAFVRDSLSVSLYAMFVAIVLPDARSHRGVLICVLISALLSCGFEFLPLLSSVSDGVAIVLCTVIAAAVCAALFPVKQEREDD
ncbi:MAG: AzlC family ABC transporter permease [Ruminococcaceae bacterium]|nr:AzlC family ABC transporter permease [Oscillospiraceae bacterium]